MNRFAYIFFLLSIAAVACTKPSAGTDGPDGPDKPGIVLPEVPENAVEVNVFYVDFFSALDDADFFGIRSTSVAVDHIKEQTGKKPVLYMFDRADYKMGESIPAVKMGIDLKYDTPLFAQNMLPASSVEGTALLTPYIISDYDGVLADGAFMSGCTIPVPLNTAEKITIYTARIEKTAQLESIFDARYDKLHHDGVLVGTVLSSEKAGVGEFVREKGGAVRYMTFDSKDSLYDLFVIVPGGFVCRGMEPLKKVNLPYWRISIEKLS